MDEFAVVLDENGVQQSGEIELQRASRHGCVLFWSFVTPLRVHAGETLLVSVDWNREIEANTDA